MVVLKDLIGFVYIINHILFLFLIVSYYIIVEIGLWLLGFVEYEFGALCVFDQPIIGHRPIQQERIIPFSNLAKVIVFVIFGVQLILTQKPFSYFVGIEVFDGIFVFFCEFGVDFGLAQNCQQVSIIWRLIYKLIPQLFKAHKLVQ